MPTEVKPLVINQNTGDRGSFTQIEENGQKDWARRVLAHIAGQPIHIKSEEFGESAYIYQEVNSLAGLSSADILTFNIPLGKKLKVSNIIVSGENKALFTVLVNNEKVATVRTWFCNFNAHVQMEIDLTAGPLKVSVENKSNSLADFNCTVIGRLSDA